MDAVELLGNPYALQEETYRVSAGYHPAAGGAASFNYFDGTFAASAEAAEAPIAPEVDVAPVLVQQVSDYQDYSGRFST